MRVVGQSCPIEAYTPEPPTSDTIFRPPGLYDTQLRIRSGYTSQVLCSMAVFSTVFEANRIDRVLVLRSVVLV